MSLTVNERNHVHSPIRGPILISIQSLPVHIWRGGGGLIYFPFFRSLRFSFPLFFLLHLSRLETFFSGIFFFLSTGKLSV